MRYCHQNLLRICFPIRVQTQFESRRGWGWGGAGAARRVNMSFSDFYFSCVIVVLLFVIYSGTILSKRSQLR